MNSSILALRAQKNHAFCDIWLTITECTLEKCILGCCSHLTWLALQISPFLCVCSLWRPEISAHKLRPAASPSYAFYDIWAILLQNCTSSKISSWQMLLYGIAPKCMELLGAWLIAACSKTHAYGIPASSLWGHKRRTHSVIYGWLQQNASVKYEYRGISVIWQGLHYTAVESFTFAVLAGLKWVHVSCGLRRHTI